MVGLLMTNEKDALAEPHALAGGKKFISEQALLEDAYQLGVNIFNDGFRPTFIVGLWRGGSSVGIAVQECLQYLGVQTDHIALRTSYRGATRYEQMLEAPSTEIRVHGTQYLLESLNADDQLLIVDDVYSSGLNVKAVIDRLGQRLKRNLPHQIKVAVPWYKPDRQRTDRSPDYYLHTTNDWLVMPYELTGLTRAEIAMHKPYIAALSTAHNGHVMPPPGAQENQRAQNAIDDSRED